MSSLEFVTPEEVGLDSGRLARIPEFFNSYLDANKLPCMSTLVARDDKAVFMSQKGHMDMTGNSAEIDADTIFRIYSMTKPVTSVAIMMLFERCLIRLDDPISRYIPVFANMEVYVEGGPENPVTRPADRELQIIDLLTHTSGLTYSFLMQSDVDAIYRQRGIDTLSRPVPLDQFCDLLGSAPLLFSPGERWNYSNATDVLGRIVEVVSGKALDEFFQSEIFSPLSMTDTGFFVPEDKHNRLMACYARNADTGQINLADPAGGSSRVFAQQPELLSGGGGLVSTLSDYFRFCRMLARGGELDGKRLLSPKTIEYMTLNHLPNGKTIADMGDKTFSEARMDGSGFGLGFAVTTDTVASRQSGSIGSYSWGGLASTFFWIDPVEDLICIQLTQLMPSSSYPIRPQLQQLVYSSIVE